MKKKTSFYISENLLSIFKKEMEERENGINIIGKGIEQLINYYLVNPDMMLFSKSHSLTFYGIKKA